MTYEETLNTKIPAGSIVEFQFGEYSDTRITMPMTAVEDVDLKDLYIEHLRSTPDYLKAMNMEEDFIHFLTEHASFEHVPCDRIDMGSYDYPPEITNTDEAIRVRKKEQLTAEDREARRRRQEAEAERIVASGFEK